MIQTIKKLITNALLASMFFVPVMIPAVAHASDDLQGNLCAGTSLSATDTCDAGDSSSDDKVTKLIKLIINLFSMIVGVISVVMIIVGGLKYITSSGDSNNVTSAKSTILYAIIGLIIVALAQIIVKYVLSKAASVSS